MLTHWNLFGGSLEFALIAVTKGAKGKEYLACTQWPDNQPALYFLNGVKVIGQPNGVTITIKDGDGNTVKPFFQSDDLQKFSSPKVLFVEVVDPRKKTKNTFKVFRTGNGDGKQLFVKRTFVELTTEEFTKREEVTEALEPFKNAGPKEKQHKRFKEVDPLARRASANYKRRKRDLACAS